MTTEAKNVRFRKQLGRLAKDVSKVQLNDGRTIVGHVHSHGEKKVTVVDHRNRRTDLDKTEIKAIDVIRVTPREKIRIRLRCKLCGRARAVYRKFGICRICFRNMASDGLIPGVKKASW